MVTGSTLASPLAALTIRLIHLALVLFIIIVPFYDKGSWVLYALHVMAVITLVTHWMLNQDACFLTLVEATLRGIESTESFMHSLVSPVYNISSENLKKIVHFVTPILGIISFTKLVARWDFVKRDWYYFSQRYTNKCLRQGQYLPV